MSAYIIVPVDRLAEAVLQALLEEFASRDGTDYGERELTLDEKAGNLRRQLDADELCILFHSESEEWDLVTREQADLLLND
ncbi:YheU family protein [Halioglobus maricola]|uniref:YheU family protein n=1 Tax=Halioglobus maricola TaxID=2601894 RepID=A0A5P9NKK9_9GAMM|nr:YheU family protein [Halioglobus maricola]QFU76045.1 YheU family protein [Halioglobus maricola]